MQSQAGGKEDAILGQTNGNNADGLREGKTVDGKTTQYYYNGAFVINESENGSLSATNLLGVNSIIGRKAGTESAYFAKNGHGDVTKAIGLDGMVKAAYETDVWGEVTGETGTFDNPIRYVGEYYDAESGNIYLRARYYDPTCGRFLSEDPVKDGLNWYSYCGGNPVNRWDPSGLVDVMVKYAIEKNGGTVVWYADSDSVDVTLYGKTVKYYVADHKSINDRLVLDSSILVRDFNLANDEYLIAREGDEFLSEKDAAVAFGLTYNEASISQNMEYGAAIYEKNGKYSFRGVVSGIRDKVTIHVNSQNGNLEGLIHTHGAYDPHYETEVLSGVDVAKESGVDMYVVTPGGKLIRTNSGGYKFEKITTLMPYDPKFPR